LHAEVSVLLHLAPDSRCKPEVCSRHVSFASPEKHTFFALSVPTTESLASREGCPLNDNRLSILTQLQLVRFVFCEVSRVPTTGVCRK
jgi:hypothetical protein